MPDYLRRELARIVSDIASGIKSVTVSGMLCEYVGMNIPTETRQMTGTREFIIEVGSLAGLIEGDASL